MNSKLYKLRLMAAAALTLMMTMMVLTACTSDNDDNPTPQPTDGKALVGTWVSDLTGKTHTMWTYGKAWNVWTFNADGTGVCDVYFTSNVDFVGAGNLWNSNINAGYEQCTFHKLTGWGNWLHINTGLPWGNPTSGGGGLAE